MKKEFIFLLLIGCGFTLTAHAQSPISDLTCRQDLSAGAIWLSWTVPSSISSLNAYEVRYIQGNTMHWDNAILFSQNWSSGTPGTKKQELVTGLNPGTQYTFAIKWKDSAGDWSDPIKSCNLYCSLFSKLR
jgi:hypothetical protein